MMWSLEYSATQRKFAALGSQCEPMAMKGEVSLSVMKSQIVEMMLIYNAPQPYHIRDN